MPPEVLASNNPFKSHALAGRQEFAPHDIVADLNKPPIESLPTADTFELDQRQGRPVRPSLMSERHRSSSAPNVNSPSSSGYRLQRKPPPPPPRPIFPLRATDSDNSSAHDPPSTAKREKDNLERQEKILLQRAIDESRRESTRRQYKKSNEEDELQRAIEASRLEARTTRSPTMSSRESAELERALALSTAEHESRLPRSSNTPSPSKAPAASSSNPSTPRAATGRSRSVSNPEALPPFPFTEQDLVRPSYPKEKSHLFPQGLPSLPPGAGTTQNEYEREMEMLTLAIRMSEEEERLRQEREEAELKEVVRRVEEKENSVIRQSSARTGAMDPVSPTSSPKQPRRSSWFRPPLASKFSTTASSPPASPPLSPESLNRPGLEPTPTDSTIRSGATSFRSAVESLPFTNLIPTSTTTPAASNDLSSRLLDSSSSSKKAPPHPQRKPPAPPPPTRLPPSPPETPVVSNASFPPPPSTTNVAPPIPPLPASYANSSRSRKNTTESETSPTTSSSTPTTTTTTTTAQYETFRLENDGSPVEMPYLTPSASNSIRSMYGRSGGGGGGAGEGRNVASWGLEERNGSNHSSSGGSGSQGGGISRNGDGSSSLHSRGNSFNRTLGTGERFGTTVPGHSPPNRSEESHDFAEGSQPRRSRESYEEGDELDGYGNERGEGGGESQSSVESMTLAIRNPDLSSSPALPIELKHEGGFVGEPPAVDIPRDVEAGDPYAESDLEGGGGAGMLFESAYAGRSMSAIDEQTEPASSIVAEEDFSRQGSYPSTHGSLDSTVHQTENRRVLEGFDGGEMRKSITYHAKPIDEREWMHDSVLRRPSHPPLLTNSPPPPTSSQTPTPPRQGSPTQFNVPSHARQVTASSAVTNSSAGPRLSFPLPPFNSSLSPLGPSPTESTSTSLTTPTTATGLNPTAVEPPSTRQEQGEEQASAVAFADGTRFGHPSICAREPGHVCPDDGLDGTEREVPEAIELTALLEDPSEQLSIGLGFNRRREETGGKSILRDAWAVESRSWGSLLRFLMWYGETQLVASPQDIALEPTRHCTAAASLEFRPDDEGYTIIRLVVMILPPDDPDAHSHRELSVEHPGATTPPAYTSKGKGKARSYFQHSAAEPTSTLATFRLPDSVHLPCRLSNLAIQLYTLRHLASIARSTQPAKEGGTASYVALRELSTALEGLTSIAQLRQDRDSASSNQSPAHYRSQSGGGAANRSDENERLLTRLRDRLRRLKRGSTGGGGGGGGMNDPFNTSPTKPNKLVKPPPANRRDTNLRDSTTNFAPMAQTMMPTQRVQQLSRTERVLSANDHDQEDRVEEVGSGRGSGNHLEVDGARWSIVRREPVTARRALPEAWSDQRNLSVGNETAYLPELRS